MRRCYGHWTTGPSYYGSGVSIIGSGALVENCITESLATRTSYVSAYIVTTSASPSDDNHFIADVARTIDAGFATMWRGSGGSVYASGTLVRDSAAIGTTYGSTTRRRSERCRSSNSERTDDGFLRKSERHDGCARECWVHV